MSHADRPYVTRPLAGVDHALGDGRARQPGELLEALRERLGRLDQNHPSATRPESAQGSRQESTQDSPPDRVSLRKEGTGGSSGDQPVDPAGSELPAVRQAGRPAAAAADGGYHVIEARRADGGERYRPWFADEPGTPWFIGGG